MINNTRDIYYHYTSVEGLYGIIKDTCIYATHISYLNDPSEEEYFKSIVDKLLDKNEKAKKTYLMLYNYSYENTFDNYDKYIISFSELSDSLPLWNYYSKGNGYNLGFQLKNIIDNTEKIKHLSSFKAKIIYDEDEQIEILSKFLTRYENNAERYEELSVKIGECQKRNNEKDYQLYSFEQDGLIEKFMDEYAIFKKMFKHPSYSNEKEVRLVIEVNDEFNKIYYRRTNNGYIIPFIKIPISLDEDILSITLHPLQNNVGLNGLNHFLKSMELDLHGNVKISKIPFREL